MFETKIAVFLAGAVVGLATVANLNLAPATTIGLLSILPNAKQTVVRETSLLTPILSLRLERILKDLRRCESGNRDEAVNEVDLDGTASYGRYQFKPATLYGWIVRYGILPDIEPSEIMNVIMDGELQEKVLIEAIKENGRSEKWFLSQFPQCSRIYRFWEYKE